MNEATEAVVRLCEEMKNGGAPRWLSLCGNPGTGKTMLARAAQKYFDRHIYRNVITESDECLPGFNGSVFRNWASLIERHAFELISELRLFRFAVIDEIGVEDRQVAMSANKLYHLFNSRLGKWTVITSNKLVREIEQWDSRLSSRLFRGGNEVVELKNTPDFALRD